MMSITVHLVLNHILKVRLTWWPTLFLCSDTGLDYTLVTSPDSGPALNDTAQAALYAELASGGETGEYSIT